MSKKFLVEITEVDNGIAEAGCFLFSGAILVPFIIFDVIVGSVIGPVATIMLYNDGSTNLAKYAAIFTVCCWIFVWIGIQELKRNKQKR